jgi:hypothetical protein
MIKITRSVSIACLLLGSAATWSTAANAQATRTWVSGVGDDVNPCSRTAPCKTFAGAISKTAAGGEINCLDPAGYGAVTITKSLTIDCHFTEGGVLAGGNGIVVNALSTDTIFLRGLDIFGVNPPSNGIRFIAGGALHVEDCVIRRFNAANSAGISFAPSGASQLFVNHTVVAENGNGATGGGIVIQPTGSGSAKVTLVDVSAENNANINLMVDASSSNSPAGINVLADNSRFSGSGIGVEMKTAVGSSGGRIQLTNVTVFNNNTGLLADGGIAGMRVGNSTINANNTGLAVLNGGTLNTYGDNRVDGNVSDGSFTLPALGKH